MDVDDCVIVDDDDDNEDDALHLPSAQTCMELCETFVEFTETDKPMAMMYLQQNQWDLEVCHIVIQFMFSMKRITRKPSMGKSFYCFVFLKYPGKNELGMNMMC